MSYRDRQLLADIQAAIDAIRSHLKRGDLLDLERAVHALNRSLTDQDDTAADTGPA